MCSSLMFALIVVDALFSYICDEEVLLHKVYHRAGGSPSNSWSEVEKGAV